MSGFSIANRTITILFLLGNVLLLLLILFSGTTNKAPIDRFYWLQANTSDIPNAPYDVSAWTFWGLCEKSTNGKIICSTKSGHLSPGYPLSPYDNFNTETNVPSTFITNEKFYYYMSRFDFAFVWLGLIFSGVNLLIYAFTFCSYAFLKVVWFLQILATLFVSANAAVQTAVIVMARNAFRNNGQSSSIGLCMMAMNWAACFISIVLFFTTGGSFISKAYASHKNFVQMEKYKEDAEKYQQQFTNSAPTYTQPATIVPINTLQEPVFSKTQPSQEYVGQNDPAGTTAAASSFDFNNSTYDNESRQQNGKTGIANIASQADLTSTRTAHTTNTDNKYGIKFFKIRRDKENETDEESV